MHTSASRLSLLQLHISVALAGGAGLFAKFVAVSPAVITCGRTLFGSLALAIAAVAMKSSLRLRSRRDLLMLALSGAILAVHWFSFFVSIQVSTVAIGLLAFSTFPLFVTFLEPVVFGERLHRYDIMTALVVVAGLVLVTPNWDISNHLTQGMLWGVFSAFTYAVLSLLSRSYARVYPTLTVAFYQQAFAALCALPLALRWQGVPTGRDIWLLIVLGVVFTGLAQGLAVASLRHLRAQTVGVAFGLEPVYGILFAWLLLNEHPAARTLCGGFLILCAVIWASFKHGNSASTNGPPDVRWQRILVTTDFSPASLVAVRYGRALAEMRNAGLTVVNVVEPFHVDWKMDTSERQHDDRAEAGRAMAALAEAELRGVASVRTELRPGQPAEAIVEFAKMMQADLLVIATQGRTGLARVVMGSVAEQVVRHAPCAVLVVRPEICA